MRIGIDIDGVLTDIEQWQLDYGSKFYFEKYNKQINEKEWFNVGEYKKKKNFVGNITTSLPSNAVNDMKDLMK